jgi:hypothetical protein
MENISYIFNFYFTFMVGWFRIERGWVEAWSRGGGAGGYSSLHASYSSLKNG